MNAILSRLIDKCIRHGIIKDQETDVYRYGFDLLVFSLINIILWFLWDWQSIEQEVLLLYFWVTFPYKVWAADTMLTRTFVACCSCFLIWALLCLRSNLQIEIY